VNFSLANAFTLKKIFVTKVNLILISFTALVYVILLGEVEHLVVYCWIVFPHDRGLRMFYLLNLERELEIPPRYFGPKLRSVLEERLKSEVSYRLFSGRHFGSDAYIEENPRCLRM
jgi:hypothetical protein